MAKRQSSSNTINSPPFPPLVWGGYFWSGDFCLPSLAGFQTRLGSYGARTTKSPSSGTCKVSVASENEDSQPTKQQQKAFQFLIDHEATIVSKLLHSIFTFYPEERSKYGYTENELAKMMPAIDEPTQLHKLIGLSTVHLLSVEYGGVAYIGFEFGCTWDQEHGLGLMTHKKRVIDIGGADSSFLECIAERDVKAQKKAAKRKKA